MVGVLEYIREREGAYFVVMQNLQNISEHFSHWFIQFPQTKRWQKVHGAANLYLRQRCRGEDNK